MISIFNGFGRQCLIAFHRRIDLILSVFASEDSPVGNNYRIFCETERIDSLYQVDNVGTSYASHFATC